MYSYWDGEGLFSKSAFNLPTSKSYTFLACTYSLYCFVGGVNFLPLTSIIFSGSSPERSCLIFFDGLPVYSEVTSTNLGVIPCSVAAWSVCLPSSITIFPSTSRSLTSLPAISPGFCFK